jgi:predicted esterase YcpF (UPF0227 family)
MNDIECPYCGEYFEDQDYYENEHESLYELECPKCNKIMMCQYTMYPYFESFKAPCKNGGDHKLKEIHGYPDAFFKYKRRCEYCNEEFIIDKEKYKETIKKYYEELDNYK